MKVSTRIVVDIETDEIISRETFDYHGPVALAISGGGGTKKQKSQSEQSSEAGYAYNEPFLNLLFGQGGQFYGTSDGKTPNYTPGVFGYEPGQQANLTAANYTGGAYTPGQFTAVAPEGFGKLEQNLYGGAQSKLSQAYNQAIAKQREELSQAGALNSPAQYLEGSARSSMDRSYLDSLQQAARDASTQRIGLESQEAGRRTAYDVGQGAARTAYDVGQGQERTAFDVGQATQATEFSQKQSDDLWKRFMAKLAVALEASKYQRSSGTSYGTGSGFDMNLGILSGGGGGGGAQDAASGLGSLMALFA